MVRRRACDPEPDQLGIKTAQQIVGRCYRAHAPSLVSGWGRRHALGNGTILIICGKKGFDIHALSKAIREPSWSHICSQTLRTIRGVRRLSIGIGFWKSDSEAADDVPARSDIFSEAYISWLPADPY